ncbi:ferrous iron transporter B [Dermatophilus congolensis]|uniref:Ferrous iron transport protein B n=1 Tax=Dermatophilus congolensis TaxID=1863 RepID=A0A239V6V0_9MICO|nr:ferrous iron transporter B [Dermatophilus congolensis]MBO3130194.1 ferrous iron transporter B [Dermatophilus congolensis]MBO3131179.1 ferrous iron transporter B [Dermatophilus congolensis]MBO3134665.1 ferrous iron transporter B [Dermatophilus congolensis]MBO3136902.1 ferrous iron transporter B [Dermatophilus congolensis]MBO3139146.1 ferrous iron transporter B [Dermatophilus congolensis]
MNSHCEKTPHNTPTAEANATRIALIGAPNSGKTTLFNALTGLHAKTGNYPGVTVAKYEGTARGLGHTVVIEDLPGTYSLDPISPDEQIVSQVLDPADTAITTPDALLVILDATALRRSLGLLAQVMATGLPVTAVVTFTDEVQRRSGNLNIDDLQRALGIPVVSVVAGGNGIKKLRTHLEDPTAWPLPSLPPPLEPSEGAAWAESVLNASGYHAPEQDVRTRRIDALLLHPILGTLVFATVMFSFFQVIFSVATPLQDMVEEAFGVMGQWAGSHISSPWFSSFVKDALIGGVGGVAVFLPQIALLFLMVSILESVGYLSRAAFLMDRLMARTGLEGRAFVALLSSFACAIPGMMATRTLPSARDRIATMMVAPLMTCSARLPVYVLLIGMLVPDDSRVGPFGMQGLVMFALYVLGAVSAMLAAFVIQKLTGRDEPVLPFYMEIPPYRVPKLSTVALAVWEACAAFVRKVTTVILAVTIVLWLLLNLPVRGLLEMQSAGVDISDEVAVSQYTLDHSAAATVGKAIEPVFAPLGFDWRINVGVVASLAAREVFVATLGQIAAASDPEEPATALERMTVSQVDRATGKTVERQLFDAPTTAALLVFFVYALQCMSTVVVMRRESNTWKWPVIAFGYMFVLAWVAAFITRSVVGVFV